MALYSPFTMFVQCECVWIATQWRAKVCENAGKNRVIITTKASQPD